MTGPSLPHPYRALRFAPTQAMTNGSAGCAKISDYERPLRLTTGAEEHGDHDQFRVAASTTDRPAPRRRANPAHLQRQMRLFLRLDLRLDLRHIEGPDSIEEVGHLEAIVLPRFEVQDDLLSKDEQRGIGLDAEFSRQSCFSSHVDMAPLHSVRVRELRNPSGEVFDAIGKLDYQTCGLRDSRVETVLRKCLDAHRGSPCRSAWEETSLGRY